MDRLEKKPLLTVEHLMMVFSGLVAVNDVSFTAHKQEITAIIGPNGAGKTTMFNCLTGFYSPTSGQLSLRQGKKTFLLERMRGFEIAKKARVARTFQNIRLFSGMSVLENLVVAQHNELMKASLNSLTGLLGLPGYHKVEQRAKELASYWLEHIKLLEKANHPAGSLPYGEQRKLEIARAMCTNPVLLCLDEPAAGLNPYESSELGTLLRFIRDEHQIGVLLIEHDMSVVMDISDHIVVLDYGRKIAEGSAEQIRNNPAVIAAYLGEETNGDTEKV